MFTSALLLTAAHLTGVATLRFDEYDYPDETTFDPFTSYGFPCGHVGAKCETTAECCGVGTCVLASWSSSAVCLVPGYKDRGNIKKILQHEPSLAEVIIQEIQHNRNRKYSSEVELTGTFRRTAFGESSEHFSGEPFLRFNISESGNTSGKYLEGNNSNMLFSDTINSTESPLEINTSTIRSEFGEQLNLENNMSLVDEDVDPQSFDQENKTVFEEPFEKYNKSKFRILRSGNSQLSSDANLQNTPLVDRLIPLKSATENLKSLGDFTLNLQNRLTFLIINSTVKYPNPSLQQIYASLDSDQFRAMIRLLQDKIRRINDIENVIRVNLTSSKVFMKNSDKSNSNVSQDSTTSASVPESKWSLVKRYFLHKPNKVSYQGSDENKDFNLKSKTVESSAVGLSTSGKNTNESRTDSSRDVHKNINYNKINTLVTSRMKKKKFRDSESKINEEVDNVVVFSNIDIPYNLDHENNLVNTQSKISSADDQVEQETKNLTDTGPALQLNIAGINSTNNQKHKWKTFYVWPIHKNMTLKFTSNFRNWFNRKGINDSPAKKTEDFSRLNEHFLLSLNSKKDLEKGQDSKLQNKNINNLNDYPITGSSSAESNMIQSDDLYNTSYVFEINKHQGIEPEKFSKWKSILNFLHLEKEASILKEEIVNPGSDSKNLVQEDLSDHHSTIPTVEVIRLPESLMPETLEKRQPNGTDLFLFEDFDDSEDGDTKDYGSTNSTFWFFFKSKWSGGKVTH